MQINKHIQIQFLIVKLQERLLKMKSNNDEVITKAVDAKTTQYRVELRTMDHMIGCWSST